MSDPRTALFKPLEKLERTAEECFELLTQEREARICAETASRKKDEFLLIVAHELRNPLNLIVGWLEMPMTGVKV
jgi:signal transduction histidine kinase